MPSKHQSTGMRGVFLVAAEIARYELIVSPTSRSAAGADLLVTDDSCAKAYSVQVKTNRKPASFWLVGERAQHLVSPSHVYVFVNIRDPDGPHDYYVVPSHVVAQQMKVEGRAKSTWPAFRKSEAEPYRNNWPAVGAPAESRT